MAEIFSASVGTAADAGDDGVVVACANAVSGVAHSSRITDMRTRLLGEMTGEKPANEICVVIDSGEPKLSPPCVNAMSSRQKNGTLRRKKCSCEIDQNILISNASTASWPFDSADAVLMSQCHFEGTKFQRERRLPAALRDTLMPS